MTLAFRSMPTPVPEMRMWWAASGGFSFIISQDLKAAEEGDPEWSGYTASWKNERADMLPFGEQPANMIDGGPWPRFTDAARACDRVLRQLRARQ
jgi:hypothetical protein